MPPMVLAGLFAGLLILALVLGDWFHFTSLTVASSRYGCRVGLVQDPSPFPPLAALRERFDRGGVLQLPNGVARLFAEERRILLRPQYGLLSRRFRTAWPIKGSVELEPDGEAVRATCVKRVPWSSAVLTLIWFLLVGVGTLAFAVAFLIEGGLASLGSLLMGLGIVGLGLLVLAFGLVTVLVAYRLEDQRLTLAYQDLRGALLQN
ncbi:MAG: hypothetical protein AB1411_09830 [Nitrospirota bacterium]